MRQISDELLQATLSYLSTKPAGEVHVLVLNLQNCHEITEEEPAQVTPPA